MKFLKKWGLRLALFILWLAFSVIVGGLVLAVKQGAGINVFSTTGYHAFRACLIQEMNHAVDEKTQEFAPAHPPHKNHK
ncbi:MAG: hypothetical protein AB7S81_01200 [Bdellovibrionales bacterium]